MPVKVTSILDSYWVIPGKLLAGEYPGAWEENEARSRLRWLLEQGVTAWIDLTEEGSEGLPAYDRMLAEEAAKSGISARYTRLSIEDFSTPTVEHMKRILDKLDALLDEGQMVYLHCYGGIGRTGTTVGCYLVRHGWKGEEAIRQINEWRKDIPSGWRRSPETEAQNRFVLDWG